MCVCVTANQKKNKILRRLVNDTFDPSVVNATPKKEANKHKTVTRFALDTFSTRRMLFRFQVPSGRFFWLSNFCSLSVLHSFSLSLSLSLAVVKRGRARKVCPCGSTFSSERWLHVGSIELRADQTIASVGKLRKETVEPDSIDTNAAPCGCDVGRVGGD